MRGKFPEVRLRRLRQNPFLRDLVREVEVNKKDLVLPLFIKGKEGKKVPIESMPGHFQIPLSELKEEIEEIVALGIQAILLFGIPSSKDPLGKDSYREEGIIQQAIQVIRKASKNILILSDVCLCEYTDHGHCGIFQEDGKKIEIENDSTLDLLVKQAVSHAKAGVDVIAPSGMMDGMVQAIRKGLDEAGFSSLPILSYSVKYQSSLYGPFRFAAEGAPLKGDRSTHQMDFSNRQEAFSEVAQDLMEGADMIMVKPAHTYLDILRNIKQAYPEIPLAAYHTSGEFAMIKGAAEKGWIEEKKVMKEVLTAIKRAGADFIITYYAKEFCNTF